MFWQKKENKVFDELKKLCEILEIKVAKLDAEVELINKKLKKPIYKKEQEEAMEEKGEEWTKPKGLLTERDLQ